MLSDLIAQLIKTVHDFVSKAPAATNINDLAVTAEDIVGIVPEILAPNVGLVADIVTSAISIAKAALPASTAAQPAVAEALNVAGIVASTITPTTVAAPTATTAS